LIFFLKSKKKLINENLKKFSFYTENDVKFRITRDLFLSRDIYKKVMKKMFRKKNFKIEKIKNQVFLQKKDLVKLHKLGHEIGLHSHTHPTTLKKLNYKNQFNEYHRNNLVLKKILKTDRIQSMSHPCGSYNLNTLKILKKMKIDIGFKQIMINKNSNSSKFEICRQDHSNIVRAMESVR
tara:strand:+ start:243 stop:782 length:540 start_codon:yes stop_codon:yes gene_type:complete